MSTIAEKLALLMNTKSDLKASLAEKGQSVTDENVFADYPDKVRAIEAGTQLPTLTNPGAASDLASGKQMIGADGSVVTGTLEPGIDTSDATATASDIASGKTAYVDGEKVTGTVAEVPYNLNVGPVGVSVGLGSTGGDIPTIYIRKSAVGTNQLIRSDKGVYAWAYASEFGDATAADVAAGKTFTSAAGVKLTGTAAISGNEQVTFSVINNSSGTIWVESISPNDGSAVEQMVPIGGSYEVHTLTGMFTVIGSNSDISLNVTEAFSVAAAVGFIPTASTTSVTVTDV